MTVLGLFAGPGGWDVAMPGAIGIEHDASACATRAAAGHLTIRADVSTWPLPKCRVSGLIASPPCQTFSAAGNRDGIAHLGALMGHVRSCITGWRPFVGADSRTTLVLEPLRFALGSTPDWIALEQVPDVLPIWEAYAYTLRALGWSVWTGILNAADFGVPQTRRRAILMAHRKKAVQPPEPTHCEGGAQTMFGELLPWVSMADALGWDGFDARYQRGAGLTERHGERPDRECEAPAPTLTGSALGAGAGAKLKLVPRVRAGSAAEAPLITESPRNSRPCSDSFAECDNCGHENRLHDWDDRGCLWGGDQCDCPRFVPPSFTLVGNNTIAGGPLAERSSDEPAMTVGTRADLWTLHTNRGQDEDGNRQTRDTSAPAPAPAFSSKSGAQWAFHQPATTIAADSRITARCHHDEGSQGRDAKTTEQVRAGDYEGTEPIKLTVRDALILQSFDPSYPVQGTKTKQFEQIGNAIPPRLAHTILAELSQ